MRAVGEARLPNTSTAFERHIDRCLGCRACEQVCPAGVEYGQLLEAARAELFTAGEQRGRGYKLLRYVLKHVWLHPARLRVAFGVARLIRDAGLARLILKSRIAALLSTKLEFGLALLESSAGKQFESKTARVAQPAEQPTKRVNPQGDKIGNTLLFTGCVGQGLFSRVNEATIRVLRANNFNVEIPQDQVCCGALHAHAGDLEGARVLARRNIEAFATDDLLPIVTNAGGCGAMLASYGHLLAHDEPIADQARNFSARVRDVSQQLETVELRSGAPVTDQLVTYDASCHLLYGQHAGEAPLRMVVAVPELSFAELPGSERCCGGAGIYNLLEPNLSRRVLEEKLDHLKATGAEILATGNPGCQMQIGAGAMLAGMKLTVCHPVELLDQSYAQAGVYEKGGD